MLSKNFCKGTLLNPHFRGFIILKLNDNQALRLIYLCMMGMQEIVVICLFAAAMVYIGRMIYKNLNTKKGCGHNCKCGIDFSDIQPEKEIKR